MLRTGLLERNLQYSISASCGNLCVSACLFVWMYVCILVRQFLCRCGCVFECMCVCVCMCVCACVHLLVCAFMFLAMPVQPGSGTSVDAVFDGSIHFYPCPLGFCHCSPNQGTANENLVQHQSDNSVWRTRTKLQSDICFSGKLLFMPDVTT